MELRSYLTTHLEPMLTPAQVALDETIHPVRHYGAFYQPDTGECVERPPAVKFLLRVALAVNVGRVLAVRVDDDVP